jgi:AraC-like DNA-binding protein
MDRSGTLSAAGSSIFTDADGYQASLRDVLDLLVLHPQSYHAHLTWVELPHVRLLRAQESSARVGYFRLPPGEVFVFFVTRQGMPMVYAGLELQFGDLIWHSHNSHQRMTEASQWGSIAVTGETLSLFGRSVAGKELQSPSWPRRIRPASADSRKLLRLHKQAARIAETCPNRIMNPEVVRALDQDLIASLVSCLASADESGGNPAEDTSARVCVKLEQLLSTEPFQLYSIRQICQVLGVSEQIVRTSCRNVLGMGPGRYQRLRRLKLVRGELMHAGAARTDVAKIMTRYRFADLHRFVAEHWQMYGGLPPLPARVIKQR